MKSHIPQSLLILVQPWATRAGTRLLPDSSSCRNWQLRRLANGPTFHEPREIDPTYDQRARLSRLWVPTGGFAASSDEDSHSKLIRAGFLRQAHLGIFHMLPLGRRVQDKLEALIDKHMSKLSASKLALSSISSQELWARSGRLELSSEIFRFKDRKDVGYLLAPTHEEEITSLVGSTVKSYKELPIRLYQISRKYRDELRPRHGLLRSREFIMKDLYTFDYNAPRALATYDEVRNVYAELFDELKIPYLVARADSGDMGGNLSHEFHFPTTQGEDYIISCLNGCGYVANEELAESPVIEEETGHELEIWRGISRDRQTLINVWYPPSASGRTVNLHAVKAMVPEFDPSIERPSSLWLNTSTPSDSRRLVNLVDGRLSNSLRLKVESNDSEIPYWPSAERPPGVVMETISQNHLTKHPLNLLRIMDGDACPECSDGGALKVQKAIELGHTFHLGTRYSEPLSATVTVPMELLEDKNSSPDGLATPVSTSTQKEVPMQMGCHGIGVSRIIGAVADNLADKKGLNWPRALAPYEIVVVPGKGLDEDAVQVYDMLSHLPGQRDVIVDDRTETFPWKMRDADLVGYPIILVLGRKWKSEGACEVQCRRLKIREDVLLKQVPAFVDKLLAQL